MSAILLTYFNFKVKFCINRGCFSLLKINNITCSHCERDSLALVLVFSLLEVIAQLFEGVISW
jgi:hypothetical protein